MSQPVGVEFLDYDEDHFWWLNANFPIIQREHETRKWVATANQFKEAFKIKLDVDKGTVQNKLISWWVCTALHTPQQLTFD